MMNSQPKFENKESGFTLLEALLVVGISAIILTGAVQVADDWMKRIANKYEARFYQTVMNATEEYLQVNFGDIWTIGMGETFVGNGDGVFENTSDINNLNRVLRIGINAPATGNTFFLSDGTSALPAGFASDTVNGPAISHLGYEVRVFVRNLGYVGGIRTLEAFVAAGSSPAIPKPLMSIARASSIAKDIGPEGGVVSMLNPRTTLNPAGGIAGGFCAASNVVGSIYGGWSFTMDVLNGANPINADNAYCPPIQPGADNQGAYVIMRRIVAVPDNILEDILYRVAIPGRLEANQMQANLDMNSLPIQNVNSMTADDVDVQGSLNMNINPGTNLYIDETASFNNVTVTRAADFSGGNVIVYNSAANPTPSPAVTAGALNAADASVRAENSNVSGTATIANQMIANTTMNISGPLSAGGIVGTTPASVLTANAVTTGVTQTSDLNVANTVPGFALGSGLVTSSLDAQNSLTVNTIDFVNNNEGTGGIMQVTGSLDVTGSLNADQVTMDNLNNCESNWVHHYDSDTNDGVYGPLDQGPYGGTFDCSPGAGPPQPLF